jgi:hypothetical protein
VAEHDDRERARRGARVVVLVWGGCLLLGLIIILLFK